MSDEKTYDEAQVRARIAADLPHWYYAAGRLCRRYHTGGWKGTLLVVNAVGHLAEAAWHHPDLAVAYAEVTVTLTTHSAGGVTDKDLELARRIEDMLTWRPGPGSALEGTPDDPRYTYIKYD